MVQSIRRSFCSNTRASWITFIARRRIWLASWITWLSLSDEPRIYCRLLWSWYARLACFCFCPSSLVMADGICERSWSAVSMAWFTRLSSCRRQSRSASSAALFLRIAAWVSFRDLISSQADFTKALEPSLWLAISSCRRRSASCFWALRTCTRGSRWRLQESALPQLIPEAYLPDPLGWHESAWRF